MSLQKLGTQLIKSQPTLHAQNVKLGSALTGGGFRDQTVETSPDLTYLAFNNIPGASLYVTGSTTSVGGTFPNNAATSSIINNPDGSTHKHECYVTLPAGEYYAEYQMCGDAAGQEAVGLYNLTNSSWIAFASTINGSGTSTGRQSARFSLSVTSNIELRTPIHYSTPAISDLGVLVAFNANGLVSEAEFFIYKLD
jgi:hypothetical protein